MSRQVDDGGKGRRRIAVDFDGVIHSYSKGWNDGVLEPDTISGALEGLIELDRRGFEVVIFTSRNSDGVLDWVLDRFFEAGLAASIPRLSVTDSKPIASAYIDDRGIRFESWEQALRDVEAYVG